MAASFFYQKHMNTAYLLLGGNVGNTREFITLACSSIEDIVGHITLASSLYESEPWGFSSNQNFINQVVEINTELSAPELLEICKTIEKKLGRETKTTNTYKSRVVDIDILFFNSTITTLPELTIPHPRLHLRRFTLEPLAEIIPNFIHPVLKLSVKKLLDSCNDNGFCSIIDNLTKHQHTNIS
jgi:2-amino-4-hydroxy-6-hydroxymethyldihydropteridine diphosphokinase